MKKCLLRSEDERKERHGLHSDLVVDILARLDAKTLSNCRRVCKTWYQIISDPIFIAARRKFMLRNSNLLFVDRWRKNIEEGEGVCTFSICDHNVIDREEGDFIFTPITSPTLGLGRNMEFSPLFRQTTCDLICRTGTDSKSVYLYNPRTGKVYTLPACPGFDMVAAYGYVASAGEYTVVAYTAVAGAAGREGFAKFSFTDSSGVSSLSWKEIDVGRFPGRVFRHGEILINNCVYWQMMDLEIVSLDLDKNTFAIIKCPEEFRQRLTINGLTKAKVIDFEGSLCLLNLDLLNVSKELIVWEFLAKTDSWKKKYHVKHDFQFHIHRMHLKSKEGDLILYGFRKDHGKGKYLMFNPETKRVKHIKVPYSRGTIKDVQPPIGQIQHQYNDQVSFLW